MKNKYYAIGIGIIIGIFIGAFLSSVTNANAECGKAFVACYDDDGRMTQINATTTDEDYLGVAGSSLKMTEVNKLAKVFILSNDGIPLCKSIEIENAENITIVFDGTNKGGSVKKLLAFTIKEMRINGGNGEIILVTSYADEAFFIPTDKVFLEGAHNDNIHITIVSLGGGKAGKYLRNWCDYYIEVPKVDEI